MIVDKIFYGQPGQESAGFKEALNTLWSQNQAYQDHYFIFHFGNQNSLLKANFSKNHIQIAHEDFTAERSAYDAIRKPIIDFVREKLNSKETDEVILKNHFQDLSGQRFLKKNANFIADYGSRMDISASEPASHPDSAKAMQLLQSKGLNISEEAAAKLLIAEENLAKLNLNAQLAKVSLFGMFGAKTKTPNVEANNMPSSTRKNR